MNLRPRWRTRDLADDAYTALADEVEALEAEREAIGRGPRIMPAELASRVGTFLTLSRAGEMLLDSDFYSETPLRITMVEEEPETGRRDRRRCHRTITRRPMTIVGPTTTTTLARPRPLRPA